MSLLVVGGDGYTLPSPEPQKRVVPILLECFLAQFTFNCRSAVADIHRKILAPFPLRTKFYSVSCFLSGMLARSRVGASLHYPLSEMLNPLLFRHHFCRTWVLMAMGSDKPPENASPVSSRTLFHQSVARGYRRSTAEVLLW